PRDRCLRRRRRIATARAAAEGDERDEEGCLAGAVHDLAILSRGSFAATLIASRPMPTSVPFRDAFRLWLRVGLLSFGGPAGQIATMHRLLVEERRWISERRFLHALSFCMLLPGPEAQQLAIYVGWLLNGTLGGVVAGALF